MKSVVRPEVPRRSAVFLAYFFVGWLSAHAEPISLEPLFLGPDAVAARLQRQSIGSLAKRSRLVAINLTALPGSPNDDDSQGKLCRLNLFPGTDLPARLKPQALEPNLDTLTGSVEGEEGSRVILVQKGDLLAGSVLLPGRASYVIYPAASLICEVRELDCERLLPCGVPERLSSQAPQPHLQSVARLAVTADAQPVSAAGPAAIPEHKIELMVVYTAKAAVGVFGADSIEALINLAVAEADNVFQASATGVRLRLVHTAQVAYDESGQLELDLARLQKPDDGFMDEVHLWRDAYRADLVCLVVQNSTGFGGFGGFPSDPQPGFSVLKCSHLTGSGLLAHELGHSLGCDHDRENTTGRAQFPYSYGHRLQVEDRIYRTVMCYAPGWPIAYFSNPDVSFSGMSTGVPAGEPDAADNARTIREMAAVIDAYQGLEIKLTSPAEGDIFAAGDSAQITAEVASEEGAVAKVEFFDNRAVIGQAAAPPYVTKWNAIGAGSHLLSARVTLENGTFRASPEVTVGVKPLNDDFERRLKLTGTNAAGSAVLFTASAEPDEPAHFGRPMRTAWWSWSPPYSGTVRIRAWGGGSPLVAVYTGETLRELQLVARNPSIWSDLVFEVVAGQEYQIVVEGALGQTSGFFSLGPVPPPANDDFAKAQPLPLLGTVSGSTLGATRQPGEPEIGAAPRGHSVWYRVKPSGPGGTQVMLLRSGTTEGIDFAVFTGDDVANLMLVANSEQAARGFAAVPGASYWVCVDGPYGSFSLNVPGGGRPENDDFERRSTVGSRLYVNNFAATRQTGEPKHGLAGGGHSQWWDWGIAANRLARFSWSGLARGDPPLSMAIYSGTALTNLIPVAAHDFTSPLPESFTIPIVNPRNLVIAVDSDPGIRTQPLFLAVSPGVSNDDFEQRQRVMSVPGSVSGSTWGATAEPGEPNHGGLAAEHSVWWSWRCRSNALAVLKIDSAGELLPFLSVYSGDTLTNLVLVADNVGTLSPLIRSLPASAGPSRTPTPAVIFPAENDKFYQVAVDEPTSSVRFSLDISYASRPVNDDFANRSLLAARPQDVEGTTIGATCEPGEPDEPDSHSVWYQWTAPASGLMTVLAGGRHKTSSSFVSGAPTELPAPNLPDAFVAVYAGDALSNLVQLASGPGSATFQAQVGGQYQIAIEGSDNGCEDFTLNITFVPSNDAFAAAALVADGNASINLSALSLRSATAEPGEPNHGGRSTGHSLWWTWTPHRSGSYQLNILQRPYMTGANGRAPAAAAAIYEGATLEQLSVVASNIVTSADFEGIADRSYRLVLDLQDDSVLSTSGYNITVQLTRKPALSVHTLVPGDLLEFVATGAAYQSVAIQVSSDLTHWKTLTTPLLSSSEFHFREAPWMNLPARFYRAVPAER